MLVSRSLRTPRAAEIVGVFTVLRKERFQPQKDQLSPREQPMSTRIVLTLSAVLILALPLLARDKTDLLVMKNGDHMTCEVKGLDAGVLYVAFDYIDGTALVDWSKVARLESKQSFLVKTESGSVYTGSLRTPETSVDRPVKIQVIEASEQETEIDSTQIVQMVATSEKFWQRFNGEVSFGAIYSKGNQSTQYSLGSQAAYVRERWSAQALFSSNLSSSSGTNASTRNSLDLSARHLLPWNNWFYAGLGSFLQSSEEGIALQSSLGGGIGRYLKNTNRTSIAVLAGAAWQNTSYEQTIVPVGRQNMAAAAFYAEAKLFKFSKTNLNMNAALFPAVSNPGRFRFNTNTSYYIKIVNNLKWNLSFYGNWDNQPPPGFSGSDYGTTLGLSWTFGLK